MEYPLLATGRLLLRMSEWYETHREHHFMRWSGAHCSHMTTQSNTETACLNYRNKSLRTNKIIPLTEQLARGYFGDFIIVCPRLQNKITLIVFQ